MGKTVESESQMIHLAIRGHDLTGEYTPKQLAQAVGAKKIKTFSLP